MREQSKWIGIPDATHRVKGFLTRWQVYSAALEGRIESRRSGRQWQVARQSLDRYVRKLRGAQT